MLRHTYKTAQERLEECDKDLMAYESPKSSDRGVCANKLDPARLRPANHRIQCSGARHHRTTPEVLFSSLGRSEPSLIHGGASIDKTCSGTSHKCSIRLGFVQFGQVRSSSSPPEQLCLCVLAHCPAGCGHCHEVVYILQWCSNR